MARVDHAPAADFRHLIPPSAFLPVDVRHHLDDAQPLQ
jgi:hypothetical protein